VNGGRVGKRATTTTNPETDLLSTNDIDMVRSERGLDRICTPLPTLNLRKLKTRPCMLKLLS
jgi:hypothetical protein